MFEFKEGYSLWSNRCCDKISIRIEQEYINESVAELYYQKNFITVTHDGPFFRIHFHAESLNPDDNLVEKMIHWILMLNLQGLFRGSLNTKLNFLLQGIIASDGIAPDVNYMYTNLLKLVFYSYFAESVVEIAFDFDTDNPPFKLLKYNQFRTFYNYEDGSKTRYSLDYVSSKNSNGKGRQISFFKIYERDKKLGSDTPKKRVELTLSGKYLRNFSLSNLNTDLDTFLSINTKHIAKIWRKVMKDCDISVDWSELEESHPYFYQLLLESGLYNENIGVPMNENCIFNLEN